MSDLDQFQSLKLIDHEPSLFVVVLCLPQHSTAQRWCSNNGVGPTHTVAHRGLRKISNKITGFSVCPGLANDVIKKPFNNLFNDHMPRIRPKRLCKKYTSFNVD
jgi:hypothetical protein